MMKTIGLEGKHILKTDPIFSFSPYLSLSLSHARTHTHSHSLIIFLSLANFLSYSSFYLSCLHLHFCLLFISSLFTSLSSLFSLFLNLLIHNFVISLHIFFYFLLYLILFLSLSFLSFLLSLSLSLVFDSTWWTLKRFEKQENGKNFIFVGLRGQRAPIGFWARCSFILLFILHFVELLFFQL